MDRVDPDSLRQAHKDLYTRLKRNKALPPTSHGLMALAIDGHLELRLDVVDASLEGGDRVTTGLVGNDVGSA